MKILWLVNTIFPYPAEKLGIKHSPFGGWAQSLFESLKTYEDNYFCIVATYNGKELKKFSNENTNYYLIPNHKENKYNKNMQKYWQVIINDFKPNIVHIHGTEYPKSLPLIRLYPNLNYVVSIQGFLNSYKRVCNANLKFSTLLKNITIRDILKPKTGFLTIKDYEARSKYETEIIQSVQNIIGRTTWDKAQVLAINNKVNYYHGEENLRKSFYSDQWDVNSMQKQTIFFSQGQSILKGLYIMLEALNILKKDYPKVKLIIAGNNLFDNSFFKQKLKKQSYTRYLEKLVKKYDLKHNIEFTGFLDEKQYKQRLIKCNVYAQASSIENSSNSLGEAMILGVPCVASNVGGTSDMLIDKKEGYLYPYTEPELLAYYIAQYFKNDDLCIEMGVNARKHALQRHDWKNNAFETQKIYNHILKGK